MTEETKATGEAIETKKKRPLMNNSFGGMKMWWAIMAVYFVIFCIIGYVAFMPMAFNDPDNTVKKYLDILQEYQSKTKTEAKTAEEVDTLKLAMEELMKKAEESAGDIQQLASQSFNIVLGAFLAFLSATATMLFQGSRKKEKTEPEPEEKG
jgi:predicted PurR-regulated permease PerM